MKHRLPKHVLLNLRKAIEAAKFTDASFGGVHDDKDEISDQIKEQTRLYRETWIIGPLERVMRWSRGVEE